MNIEFNQPSASFTLSKQTLTNGAGIPLTKLNKSLGHPRNVTNLHSKQPSAIATRLKAAGLDWVADLAQAIKANRRERIQLWMRLLPYLVVTQGHRRVGRRKGKASKAAMAALEELEGR